MNTLQNNLVFCAVFKAAKLWVRHDLSRVLSVVLLSSIVALMFCNTALALDINQANEAELDSVKGMGPTLSAKVLKARAQGPFKDWQNLMQRVSGIRHNKAQQFSEQGLTVDGQAFAKKP
jgi:competence protein ComEA|nr:helix-hairpin-helix domain-containing protein [uncultured Limnohabitans sp.]